MNEPSDALVFFGTTGDLAYKKIFPALQAMVRRGHLNVPVIGVAKAGWDLDRLRARARDSLEEHGGLDPAARDKLGGLLRYVDGDYHDPATFLAIRQELGKDEMDAYERLLGDAMKGDATLFAREDYVEEAWRVIDPVLKTGTPVHEYEPGTWGPAEAASAVSPPGGGHNPAVSGS
jgi:glucose-6-phosphate 1-dehydrogenase